MAHLVAPQAALAELPVFFNVDGVVGSPPAENRTEDVLFVQFAFQVIVRIPKTIPPEDLAVMRAVSLTGTIDPQTIAADHAASETGKGECQSRNNRRRPSKRRSRWI